jgi:lipopolysaccharide export system ATP-binding protein
VPAAGGRKETCGRLEIRRLDKSVAGRPVVKGASFHVARGETVALLGPDGAGKTTIFHMIAGLVPADGGTVMLDGRGIGRLPMYRRARLGLGYLPREASMFDARDVEHNVRAVLDVIEADQRRREEDLEALLAQFDIARLRKRMARALSGGERRRVEMARAVAARPSYLLLDEPFAGVEPSAVSDIQGLVRQLARRGIGLLIADRLDRDPRRTLDVSDRAYVVCCGDILGTLQV